MNLIRFKIFYFEKFQQAVEDYGKDSRENNDCETRKVRTISCDKRFTKYF